MDAIIRKAIKQQKRIKACPGHEYKFSRKVKINGYPPYDVRVYKCVHCGLCKLNKE